MDSYGWECPKCGYCWAPYYPSCDNCNRPAHEKLSSTNDISLEAFGFNIAPDEHLEGNEFYFRDLEGNISIVSSDDKKEEE